MTKYISFIFTDRYPVSRFFKTVLETARSKLTDCRARQISDSNLRTALFLPSLGFFPLQSDYLDCDARGRALQPSSVCPNYPVLRGIRDFRRCCFARLHLDFFLRAKLIIHFVLLVSNRFGKTMFVYAHEYNRKTCVFLYRKLSNYPKFSIGNLFFRWHSK